LASLDRVGVIRLDALGDTLLTTPALHLLRQHWPQAQVLALTHRVGTDLLRPLCEVQEVTPQTSWRAMARILKDFGAQAVLCFSEKRRAALACWASGAGLRIGFEPGISQPLKSLASRVFFTRTFSFVNDPRRDPGLHEVERYCKLVELLVERQGLEIPPLQLQPQSHHYEAVQAYRGQNLLGLQLTPKWCRFGYNVEHLRHWLQCLQPPILGLAGPAEAEWARQHFSDIPLYCSQDVMEYAALLEQLRGLVTIDTGAAHVAAARQVATIDVFPERHHAHCVRRWRPWRCPHRIVLQPAFSVQAVEEIGQQLRGAGAELWNAPV